MAVKEPTGGLKKACWKGYTAVGMKMKNGRKVPNCVPANEEREIPLSHRTKHDVSHYRVLNNGRDVSKHDSYEEAIAHAGEHRRRLKSKGYDADKISVHAYVKEEVEKLHITLKDSLGNVHHIYRTPKGHVFASHAGVNISPAQHAYKHNGSNSERERLVANIIKKAKSSQHAAELMNSSGLGSTNWSAKEIKEEKENYGLPAHSMKHVMQKIKDGHWEVSSGEVKSGKHLSIIDHTKGKKKRMIHVKEESNEPKDREWGTTKLTKRYKKDTPGQCDCDTMKEEAVGRKRYKVGLTISHRDVASGDKKDVRVNVNASSQQKAIETAEKHYRNAGYKVHKDLSFIHSVNEESDQMDEMKSSNPKGLAYKITAASHAANPSYGPHDPSVDPKTNFGAGATRSSAVAGLRAARAIKKAGGNPHDPEHIETISKAIHGSPADYGGKSRGWSHHALTSTNQSPEQKERRSKLTGAYGGLSDDEKEKDRQIARVIAKRVHPVKESVGRDATKQLIARIKKAGGNAKRNKAGLLVTKKKSKAKLEEATGEDVYKDLRAQGVPHHVAMSRAKEHEERSKSRDYQGYHTQIHVDGRHYKAGDRMGAGEKGAQDAGRHAANIAKKTGKKVSLHMIHHETGKTLAIADHEDGKWKYRNLSEAAPIQQPKAGVEKLVSKMNPDTKAKTVSETRNIIREVIRKAVDKQGTNQANGKTATGSRAAKIEIDPVISLDANRGGVRGI
jgi:hypothetical protein